MYSTIKNNINQLRNDNNPFDNLSLILPYDIDVYDENISAENIGRVLVECKNNPWYYFREVVRIPVRGSGTVPLFLHRAGCAAIWSFIHSFDFELVQPR